MNPLGPPTPSPVGTREKAGMRASAETGPHPNPLPPSGGRGVIGLIVGNGAFPLLLAQEAKKRGDRIIAVALKEEADPAIERYADDLAWLSLGQLGKTIDFLKERQVT